MTFTLHPRLEADSILVCDLSLCQVRLSSNASFPWLILIPRLPDLRELIDLSFSDQQQLLSEMNQSSTILQQQFKPDKLNIGMLGNIVAQLHIHVIARYLNDLAWPNPVWNSGVASDYTSEQQQQRLLTLQTAYGAL